MESRSGSAQAPRAKIIAAFATIYVVWGSTYLAIKYAIETIPPFTLGMARFLIAFVLLYLWARPRTKVRVTRQHWLHALLIGTLMLGLGNGAVVWSELHIPSGITALLVAVVPLWVVLIDWLRPGGERPHGAVLTGVVVGLMGMVLLAWPSGTRSDDIDLLAILVLVLGSLSWSLGTVFGRHAAVPGFAPLTSSMQILGGGICLALISLLAGEPSRITPAVFEWKGVLALGYLVVFGSIIAFSAYSWLMRVASPAHISTYAYVNPVVAIFLGWAFAGEKLNARTVLASAVILAGVALITTVGGRPMRASRRPAPSHAASPDRQ